MEQISVASFSEKVRDRLFARRDYGMGVCAVRSFVLSLGMQIDLAPIGARLEFYTVVGASRGA
jgi:hypothetical protein